MSYEKKLNCTRKQCGVKLTVPIKLVVKGDKLIDVARCPTCHLTYKFILPMKDKSQWISLMKQLFSCDVCGTAIENWQVIGGDYMLYHADRVKLIMLCPRCGTKRAKVVSRVLWPDLTAKVEEKPEIPPPPETKKCPNCNEDIPVDAKVCPNCNREVVCSKCGTPILPRASFCNQCGSSVEKIEAPEEVEAPSTNICPSCEEEYEEESVFCPICGQELVCDKCHSRLMDGASFCTNCGDPVRKGKLSE
jgi:hypothetical protein